jgi:hypothetical protein
MKRSDILIRIALTTLIVILGLIAFGYVPLLFVMFPILLLILAWLLKIAAYMDEEPVAHAGFTIKPLSGKRWLLSVGNYYVFLGEDEVRTLRDYIDSNLNELPKS